MTKRGKIYKIKIEETGKTRPRLHELAAAEIVAKFFQSDVIFLRRIESKTPDLCILKTNTRWELKSPTGGSKHTVQNNLRESAKQSENVILDISRSKLTNQQGISRAKEFVSKEHSRLKRLKIITKDGKIVDIK